MDKDVVKVWIEGIGTGVALIGGIKALFEYKKKVALDGFQMLIKMQSDFHSNPSFCRIRNEFDGASNFQAIPRAERAEYATFFEDIALLRRSNLLSPELAFYMFGFEARRCWNSDSFWADMDRDDKWWGVLRSFVDEVDELRIRIDPDKVNL
jgi:hypothetical protein